MKKRILTFILLLLLLTPLFTLSVSADTGPKPSVKISFVNLTDTEFYVTLLSKQESTGPWASHEKYPSYDENEAYFPREIYDKFAEYKDPDGFYFLKYGAKYDGDSFEWNYYPPSTFKPLLYFPATDTFITGDIYERYAFDSYFELDMNTLTDTPDAIYPDGSEPIAKIKLTKSYDYTTEIISLIARIIITLAAELALARFAFGYRGKRLYLMLGITNLITQIVLNVTVNVKGFYGGSHSFIFYYILLELLIFAAEAAIYYYSIPKLSAKPAQSKVAVLYALSANLLSFILGLYIAKIIPDIF